MLQHSTFILLSIGAGADMRFAMPITIIEPFPTHVIAPQSIDVVESIKLRGIGGKGTVAVHSTADKTAYLPGEIARVTCDVNNTSSGQTVTAIRVNLRRYTHRRSLAAQNVPRSSMMTISTVEVPVTCVSGSNASAAVELPIPHGLPHSTNLVVIGCWYEIETIAVVDGACVTNAVALLPVK